MVAGSDVVVIGAGVEGSSIAYQCARRGMSVTIVEAREVASQASGASAGGVRQQGRDPRELPVALRAIGMWPSLTDELQADLEYYQQGHLTMVADETDLPAMEASVARQREGGLDVRMLYGDDLREIVPLASPEMIAGAYCPTDGHANPIATTKAFAAAAVRHGARLLDWTPVTRIVTDSGRAKGVETAKGVIEAGIVIVAAGAWSAALCETAGITIPVNTRAPQMMLTTRMPHALDPVVGCVGRALSLKQLRYGQYLIGGGWPATVYLDVERPIGRNQHNSISGSAWASTSVWPVLRHTQIVRVWAGLEAEAEDLVPVLGATPVENMLIATGFSGHGFALAPYIGVLLAELAATGTTPISLTGLTLDRFAAAGA
ncbi:MAG TPA: FAD-binding oxidoreductase [Thermomicrobiales bacterium]|nr:FAD-binding oxidoreductase [Thermomicrobiales bacterium]